MKNKLSDLNNHLFEQLERLNDENLNGEDLQTEIERSNAITEISRSIIENAKVQLSALKVINDLNYNPQATKEIGTQLLGIQNTTEQDNE